MKEKFIDKIPPQLSRKELSDNPVKLCNEISRIFKARMREDCDIDGVLSQQGARLVLAALAIEDGRSQRELVSLTHLKAPTVSVILKNMIDEGLVELKSDERDGRITRAYLTEFGRETDERNINKIKFVDAKGLHGLTDEEQRVLMSLLYRIRDNLLSDAGEETER